MADKWYSAPEDMHMDQLVFLHNDFVEYNEAKRTSMSLDTFLEAGNWRPSLLGHGQYIKPGLTPFGFGMRSSAFSTFGVGKLGDKVLEGQIGRTRTRLTKRGSICSPRSSSRW